MTGEQRLRSILEEMSEISGAQMAYYTQDGKCVVTTCDDGTAQLTDSVNKFLTSAADSQLTGGYQYIKIEIDDSLEGVLAVSEDTDSSFVVSKLAAARVRDFLKESTNPLDKNGFIQNLLFGNLLPVDIYRKAKKLHIDTAARVVYVISGGKQKNERIIDTLQNNFLGSTDYLTELDEKSVILIKDVRESQSDDELSETARALVDVLLNEAMVPVKVAYGNPTDKLENLTKSYQEASMALEVGRIFYPTEDVLAYTKLGIGRLIYQLPMNLCQMFIHEVFGDEIPAEIHDEETMDTIQKFLDNDLNISETARQLYVHRNTLVYRLERLQTTLGLDIRSFEDAMTFRIAYMVLLHMEDMEKEAGMNIRKR